MPNVALENPATGIIENVIVAELGDMFPEGFTVRLAGNASKGWTWDGAAYQPPPVPDPGPPPVPPTVRMVQLRVAIIRSGLPLATFDAAVNALPNDAAGDETRERWFRAPDADRSNPSLNAMAASNGVSSEQLDNLFRLAATL